MVITQFSVLTSQQFSFPSSCYESRLFIDSGIFKICIPVQKTTKLGQTSIPNISKSTLSTSKALRLRANCHVSKGLKCHVQAWATDSVEVNECRSSFKSASINVLHISVDVITVSVSLQTYCSWSPTW